MTTHKAFTALAKRDAEGYGLIVAREGYGLSQRAISAQEGVGCAKPAVSGHEGVGWASPVR